METKRARERYFRSPKNFSQVNLSTVGGANVKKNESLLIFSYTIVL